MQNRNVPRQAGDDSPLLNDQLAAGIRGDFAEGWRISEELERLYPGNRRAAFNRAWYLMMQGKLLKGLECLDEGRWLQVFGDPPLPTNKPIYHGEDLKEKHLLLCSEGGLGDEIINARFAKNFADHGAKVSISCDPSLASVFARIQGVSAVVLHKGAPVVYHDYWVPAMSAARVLELEYKDLSGKPYLSVDPIHKAKWKKILDEKYQGKIPRIGLKFFGNPKFEHEQHRKFPSQGLIEAVGNQAWINLQKEADSTAPKTDLPLDSWEDTLAVMDHLDLVITSCTSIAHAAAALGKPTWILTPILPYYMWALPGEKTPWYDSVRLFRQKKYGQWENVFADIKEALRKF